MNSQIQNAKKTEKTQTRRSLIKKCAAGVAATAAALFAPKAVKDAVAGQPMTLLVEDACFTSGPGVGVSVNNFVVVGNVVDVDGVPVTGKYFCKGVHLATSDQCGPNPMAGTFVDQRFSIDGVGSILGAGTENDSTVPTKDDLGIVGGTGRFVGAAGVYTAVVPPGGGPKRGEDDPERSGDLIFNFNIRRG